MHTITCQSFGLFLGAVSPNSDTALALFPAVLVLNIIFDGRNISEENTPRLLRWVPKVGLIRWGFEGLSLNEFEDLIFDAGGRHRGPVARTGEEALSRFGLDGKNIATVFRAQLLISAASWVMSYFGLALTRQKFEVMKSEASSKE
uniref:ABC-2 type transporter transmembrane domain-containing protein n=1 Tax=Craspedostauros australis TaxID=1486917 RepID=A0A7R9WUD8_9STRA